MNPSRNESSFRVAAQRVTRSQAQKQAFMQRDCSRVLPSSATVLSLPIHAATSFVLVNPHYPENVGAAARAIKTMGFCQLSLVKPSRLAIPEHEMAHRMAVKAWDVLQAARQFTTWQQAAQGAGLLAATTSRRGVSKICNARQFAAHAVKAAAEHQSVVILFGNEKTGLPAETVEAVDWRIRIPMAADQPSINLAQATQIIAYELFMAALEHRAGGLRSV